MNGKTTKRHDRRRELATALILGAMGAAVTGPALAQSVQQISDERIEFDIAAQPLSGALSEFARQAHVNALYFSDDLRGLSSPQLRGSYTRQQALDLLLARSGYNGRISGGNLVLAQEQSFRPQRESAANGAETTRTSNGTVSDGEEEIVVTGTRIRGAAPVGANVQTLDRDDIDQTGRSTLQDVLQTLPQNFPGSQTELSQQAALDARRNIAFGSTVDLRGLGADATLSLVNGRRLAPAGFGNFVDISGVPLAAVDRIEILPDGASATYGAYRFLTPQASQQLNEIAREDDPFARLGTSARTAVITSVVQRSEATWQVSWIEATHGADARSAQSFTGLFTVRFDRPRNADALMHNPLGLFITEFSMSPETPAASYSRVQP